MNDDACSTLAQVLFPNQPITITAYTHEPHRITLTARSTAATSACPRCGHHARSRHSTYTRRLADCPLTAQPVRILLQVRRFRCRVGTCPQRIFTERLPTLVAPSARQTQRLRTWQQTIALALGGAPAARLCHHLALPTSGTTLLRRLQHLPLPTTPAPTVIGIDDWAWRKGTSYGGIVVDLQTHRVLDLLPNQTQSTIIAWLRRHPSIQIVSRDRGGGFATAITAALPTATHVVDRWHLIKNLLDALETVVLGKRAILNQVSHALHQSPTDAPAFVGKLTRSGAASTGHRIQEQVELRRQRHAVYEALYAQIQTLHAAGADVTTIHRRLQVSRRTVYRYLAMDGPPIWVQPAPRRTAIDPYKPYLQRRWAEGCHSVQTLWREIEAQGFPGSIAAVQRYLARSVQRTEPTTPIHPRSGGLTNGRIPTAGQTVAWLAMRPAARTPAQHQFLTALSAADTQLRTAIHLTEAFLVMVRGRDGAALEGWCRDAEACPCPPIQRFAHRLRADYAAIAAGIAEPWSNGPVEGQIHRLKLLKRQMYGRAGFALLRTRMLYRV